MYFERIDIENYRNFKTEKVRFLHPKNTDGKPPLNNVNLILGANSSGKTTLLRAMATGLIPELMPRINARYLIRREGEELAASKAQLKVELRLSQQDLAQESVKINTLIKPDRGISAGPGSKDQRVVEEIYKEFSPSFFLAGYGATRWVPIADQYTVPEARNQNAHPRFQRVASLFDDSFGLMPLEAWLPAFMFRHPQQFAQVVAFINRLLPPELVKARFLEGPVLFSTQDGVDLPVHALSDSYRTYVAWIADLVYHLTRCCPPDLAYADMEGVVLVDEVDLHLHPKWQQTVLQHLSQSLPNIQFVVTSHSPLVAGTLPAANILVMDRDEKGHPIVVHPRQEIRGLDADQVLQTPVFGLESTRTPGFENAVSELYKKAAQGDRAAIYQNQALRSGIR